MALELAEMEAFQRKREAEEEHIQQEIQDAFRELNKSVAELPLNSCHPGEPANVAALIHLGEKSCMLDLIG